MGDTPYGLDENAHSRPRPAMLIRIVPAGAQIMPLRSLSFKLEEPSRRLGQAVPAADHVARGVGVAFVLARFRENRMLRLSPALTPAGLHRLVIAAFDDVLPVFDIVPVGEEVADVAFAGVPAAGGLAVFPRHTMPQIPIVVDARLLGFGICLRVMDAGRCSLEHLLHLCQVPQPPGFRWQIAGSAFFDPVAGAFFLRRADTIVLGRINAEAVGVPFGALGAGLTDHRVVEAVGRERRNSLRDQIAMSAATGVPHVYHSGGEVQLPIYAVDRPVDIGDPEPESHSEGSGEEAADGAPEELRITVLFVAYQTAPRLWTVWYQRGEEVDSLLHRVSIVCGTAGNRTRLAVCDVQPFVDKLVIVSCPFWWDQVPCSPVLMVEGDGDRIFVQVADAELRAVDMIPASFFVHRRSWDVYATFDDPRAGQAVPEVPSPGACVCFRSEGEPRPELRTPALHLHRATHVPAHDIPVNQYVPEEGLILVLGPLLEQHLVATSSESWESDVATTLRMPVEDMFLHEQAVPFDRVAVMARFPSRVVAVKSVRVYGRRPAGSGLFVDGRSAGVPLCYRVCFSKRLSAEAVAVMLDVDPPEGYSASIGIGGCVAIGQETLEVTHGAMWSLALILHR